jgi:PadR family transcriptional regulator PadR
MSHMKKQDTLGQFEQLVLTATLKCDKDYGMKIHQMVEELGKRKVKLPSVYVTLDRLEEKGYVRSWWGDATPERAYRRAKFFKVLPAGEKVLAASAETSQVLANTWREWLKQQIALAKNKKAKQPV